MTVTINGTTGIAGVDGSAGTPAVQGGDTNTGVFFPAADTVAIATGGTERARVDSSGNLGLGTSSPAARLQVTKSGAEVARFTNSQSNGGDWEFKIGGGGFEDRKLMITDKYGGADNVRATIDSSGNLVQASGCRIYSPGTYNNTTGNAANMHIATDGHFFRSTSSLKYKTDVQDAVHGLAEVLALRPVTYKGKNDGDLVFGGLIAEEVHEAGLTEFVQYAQDGSPDALAYGNMVALCIKAIQELNAKVEALEAQLAGAAS